MSSCSRTRTKAPRSARGRRNRGFSSSSSAEIVADLDDVLIQILSLLPIKTLTRFKCVSKRWLSLITNPDFSNRIIKHHPLTISGFFLHSSRAIKYSFVSLDDNAINQKISSPIPFRFTDHPTDMIIMQSTNGLLLCRCSCAVSSSSSSSNQFNTNYYVYNPTTKQYTLLPQITGDISLSLAFDPCKSPHYKVFCLRGRRKSRNISFPFQIEIEVYTSNEGPWKKLVSFPSSPSPSTFIEFNARVFWNGAVHWFAPNTRDCLSFDINQEEIKILSLPNLEEDEDDPLAYPNTLRFLDESNGNLYFIEVKDQSSSNLPVYEMEPNSSSWSVKYNVELEPLAAAFPEMVRTLGYDTNTRIYEFSIIGFVKQETDAETYIVLQIANKAVKYNFIDKTFKKLCDFNNDADAPADEFYRFQKTFQFIESLANV